MTGPEHYETASRLLKLVADATDDYCIAPHDAAQVTLWAQMAGLHLEAARVAQTAEHHLGDCHRRDLAADWRCQLDRKKA